MNEKNIEGVMGHLVSLGLSSEIEPDVRANICLQQDSFQVSYRLVKDGDTMNTIFYFDKKENGYRCSYYEASLRKKIFIPEVVVNEVDAIELDDRMARIDWKSLKQYDEVESIVTDLKKLSETTDGLPYAERLKIKFWLDTPLASLIPNVSVLKNQYEVSQRFYFFEGEQQISLDEAYRFLSHRWREKQLNAKKKIAESVETNKELKIKKGKRRPAR